MLRITVSRWLAQRKTGMVRTCPSIMAINAYSTGGCSQNSQRLLMLPNDTSFHVSLGVIISFLFLVATVALITMPHTQLCALYSNSSPNSILAGVDFCAFHAATKSTMSSGARLISCPVSTSKSIRIPQRCFTQ